jgi:hypothetical protein
MNFNLDAIDLTTTSEIKEIKDGVEVRVDFVCEIMIVRLAICFHD